MAIATYVCAKLNLSLFVICMHGMVLFMLMKRSYIMIYLYVATYLAFSLCTADSNLVLSIVLR